MSYPFTGVGRVILHNETVDDATLELYGYFPSRRT